MLWIMLPKLTVSQCGFSLHLLCGWVGEEVEQEEEENCVASMKVTREWFELEVMGVIAALLLQCVYLIADESEVELDVESENIREEEERKAKEEVTYQQVRPVEVQVAFNYTGRRCLGADDTDRGRVKGRLLRRLMPFPALSSSVSSSIKSSSVDNGRDISVWPILCELSAVLMTQRDNDKSESDGDTPTNVVEMVRNALRVVLKAMFGEKQSRACVASAYQTTVGIWLQRLVGFCEDLGGIVPLTVLFLLLPVDSKQEEDCEEEEGVSLSASYPSPSPPTPLLTTSLLAGGIPVSFQVWLSCRVVRLRWLGHFPDTDIDIDAGVDAVSVKPQDLSPAVDELWSLVLHILTRNIHDSHVIDNNSDSITFIAFLLGLCIAEWVHLQLPGLVLEQRLQSLLIQPRDVKDLSIIVGGKGISNVKMVLKRLLLQWRVQPPQICQCGRGVTAVGWTGWRWPVGSTDLRNCPICDLPLRKDLQKICQESPYWLRKVKEFRPSNRFLWQLLK